MCARWGGKHAENVRSQSSVELYRRRSAACASHVEKSNPTGNDRMQQQQVNRDKSEDAGQSDCESPSPLLSVLVQIRFYRSVFPSVCFVVHRVGSVALLHCTRGVSLIRIPVVCM